MPVELTSAALALVGLAFFASAALTALARRAAHPLGLLDRPDGRRKLHAGPTPVMGGVAIFAALLAAVLTGVLVRPLRVAGAGLEALPLAPLLLSAGLACLVGVWDDKQPLRARTKLVLQFAASLPFVVWGRSIESIYLLGWQVELGVSGYVFTAFWLVACANVINLIDGLDGLAGTVGLILTASIAGLAAMKGATEATLLALVFAGCLLGFLVHNWPPAKIFLGDSGSLLIGFVVGGLSIEASLKTTTGFALAVPLVLLSVPVFDTSMAIARRVLAGRGIGEGDRLHIHHRLQARGLSRGQALLAISGLCAAMAGVTLLSARFNSDVVALGMCVFLLALLIYGRVFGYDETLLFLRRARATFSAVSTYAARGEMRRAVLALSAGDPDWDAAWETITRQLESLGAQRLDLKISAAPDGEDAYHRQWRLDDTQLQNTPAFVRTGGWRVSLSLARPGGTTAAAEADGTEAVPASGTIPLDAVRLLAAVCQYWPHPSPAGEENSSVPVIPLRTQPDAAEERRRAA